MSFEGHYEILCDLGHLSFTDCYIHLAVELPDWRCSAKVLGTPCRRPIHLLNLVDDTNCEDEGALAHTLLVRNEEQLCKCDSCGHQHAASDKTFHLPVEGWMRFLP